MPAPGPAAFYGTIGLSGLVRHAMTWGHDWYFGDNAYFDRCRGTHFRFSRNAFQFSGIGKPDYARLAALGVAVRPWTMGGSHIVVVEQSRHHNELVGAGENWLDRTLRELARFTDRPKIIRRWTQDKGSASRSLADDLAGAWALVTNTSAAANEALLAGVPVFVTGECAASPLSSGPLSGIEYPQRPAGREAWAAGLAARQWTLSELWEGKAWESFNE